MSNEAIKKAVKNCICGCLGVKANEQVLIITDPPRMELVELMQDEVARIGGNAIKIMLSDPKKRMRQPLNTPGKALLATISASDAVITFFEDIPSELRPFRIAILEEAKKNSRIAHMVGVKVESFDGGGLSADCSDVAEYSDLLATILSKAKLLTIKSGPRLNYELIFEDLGGWHETGTSDSGLLTEKGNFGNLPAGEAFMTISLPRSLRINGKICIDRYIDNVGFMDPINPIILSVTKGDVTNIQGKQVDISKLEKILEEAESIAKARKWEPKYVRKIAELGIGTNPKANITHSTMETEKERGTIHIALGDNAFIGGQFKAPNHFDCVTKQVVLEIDGRTVLEKGILKDIPTLRREFEENYDLMDSAKIDGELLVTKSSKDVIIDKDMLFKKWEDIEGRCHITQVGDDDTSKKAAKLWNQIKRQQRVNNLINKSDLQSKEIYQLLRLINEYLLVSVEEKSIIRNVKILHEQEGKSFVKLSKYMRDLFAGFKEINEQDKIYLNDIAENVEIIEESLTRKNIDVVLERIKQNESTVNAVIHSPTNISNTLIKLSSEITSYLKIPAETNLKELLCKINMKFADIEKDIGKGQIFISYSQEDNDWLERLRIMLKPLASVVRVTAWDNTQIRPGMKLMEELNEALEVAKVAVLLVSPHFLASDFIMKHELPILLDGVNRGEILILWVLVSDCAYENTPLVNYKPANDPLKPLDSLTPPMQNSEMKKICYHIKNSISSPAT